MPDTSKQRSFVFTLLPRLLVMAAPQNHHEPTGGGFRLVHRMAQSPLGELWLALDQRRSSPGVPVLMRYVSLAGGATPDTLERVSAAGRAAKSLRSELILPVVEVLQGPLAVAYEYVEAQPLSVLQASARARELLFPVGVGLRLTIDLLRALQAVHQSWPGWPTEAPFGGLLPASVLVARDGRTRLCDALVASSALLQRGFDLSAAELAYRAPEQVYASIAPEPSTDVFIATILLWELLSGRRLLSGDKETIERKLMEHDLPRASADLRSDRRLSRGLVELVNMGLSLDPNQRPPTPGSFATALERCGHELASHADVAVFVNELAGAQLERASLMVRLALGYAAGADESESAAAGSDTAAARSDFEAPRPSVAPSEPRERAVAPSPPRQPAVAPPALPGAGQEAGGARQGAATTRSLATALARALERRQRASGEFRALPPEPAASALAAMSLRIGAAPQPPAPSGALEREAASGSEAPASALPPAQVPLLPPTASVPPLPLLRRGESAEAAAATELARDAQPTAPVDEVTTVLRAVREPGGTDNDTARPAQIRLARKRMLLAAMASVVLLIQLWILEQARSRRERSSPDEGPLPAMPAQPTRRAQSDPAL